MLSLSSSKVLWATSSCSFSSPQDWFTLFRLRFRVVLRPVLHLHITYPVFMTLKTSLYLLLKTLVVFLFGQCYRTWLRWSRVLLQVLPHCLSISISMDSYQNSLVKLKVTVVLKFGIYKCPFLSFCLLLTLFNLKELLLGLCPYFSYHKMIQFHTDLNSKCVPTARVPLSGR